MKKAILFIALFSFSMFLAADAMAQRRPAGKMQAPARQAERIQPGQRYCLNLPGLTEAQQEAIASLHAKRLEQSVQHRAAMDALRARKRELMVQASPDMNQVNTLIDEMGSMRSAHLKAAAVHRQEIRQLLTEEQRVQFDSQSFRAAGRGGRGQAMRPHQRPGRGW